MKLRGAVHIDPRTDDFFKVMVEQREKLRNAPGLSAEERDRLDQSLKVNANSGGYGIFAEMNPQVINDN